MPASLIAQVEKHEKATVPAIKQHNVRLILHLLRQETFLSRAQIAKRTRLSRPTVSDIVQFLISDGLVEEVGPGSSRTGRRPTLVSLKANSRKVVSMHIGGTKIRGAVANLNADILHQETIPTRVGTEDPLDNVFCLLDKLVSHAGSSILGIGISAPGLVNAVTGEVYAAVNLRWRKLQLGHLLQQRYGLPVYVDKDVNLAALGEFIYGAGQGYDPLAVVMLGTGIGAGLIVDGQIYHGARGAAGEIGHLIVVQDGDLCSCGRKGCLETVASGWGIARQAERLVALHPESYLNRSPLDGRNDTEAVEQALAMGDAVAISIARTAGYHLGIALTALVHVFNPRRIIIGGKVAQLGDLLFESALKGLADHAMDDLCAMTEIVPSSLGEQAWIMGAVALVLSNELGIH